MWLIPCPKERAVWLSVASGEWEPGLREHAASCPACREVALVTGAFATLARDSSGQGGLPDARQIWWRAQWLRSRATAERATRPIVLYQRVAAAATLLALGVFGALDWRWLTQWAPTWKGQYSLLGMPVPALVLVAVGIALGGIGGLLAYRAVVLDE